MKWETVDKIEKIAFFVMGLFVIFMIYVLVTVVF
jgi:hypothetical protein